MLVSALRTMHTKVKQLAEDRLASQGERVSDDTSSEIRVGDLVLLKRTNYGIATQRGPPRFVRNVEPRVYRVVKAVGGDSYAYHIVDHVEPSRKLIMGQSVSRTHLV